MPACPLLDYPGAVSLPAAPRRAASEANGAATPARIDPDVLVPAHYGNPLREQAALTNGVALTALPGAVVEVSGADRLTLLSALSSQDFQQLQAGGGLEALLLDAHGHIDYALAALAVGDKLYLVTEADRGQPLADFLCSRRFLLQVDATVRADLAVLGAHGAGITRLEQAARQAQAYVGAWQDPWPGVVAGGTSYDVGLGSQTHPFIHPGHSYAAGFVLVTAPKIMPIVHEFAALVNAELPSRAAARTGLAGMLAWEALRVEAGRPRLAREVDARAIPNELDWLRTAVHLHKGCYPGQETIARTVNLGRPPRRLTILQLDGLTGQLPAAGAQVLWEERVVGATTTVVRHQDYGPLALALLRRSVPADAVLSVAVDAPASAADPGVPPSVGAAPWARVAARQELLVSVCGRAQASPKQRPGAQLRMSLRQQLQ